MVNVFAGEPPEGVLGEWDEDGGATDSRERVRERIAEDRAALALAGCDGVYLEFLDEQYEPGDQPLADGLRPYVERATVVYGPKGTVHNDDHVRVHDALVAICPGLRLYADLPIRSSMDSSSGPRRTGMDSLRATSSSTPRRRSGSSRRFAATGRSCRSSRGTSATS